MKLKIIIFSSLFFFGSCKSDLIKNDYESNFQKKMNDLFKDASISPLTSSDLKNFKFLSFFPLDSTFIVKSKLLRTPNAPFQKMKTNNEAISTKLRVYGTLYFNLKGNEYSLKVYQDQSSMSTDKEYLLLPFFDDTNGNSTYGGGRYVNLKTPKNDCIIIDFNKSINPYCAYNEEYSCLKTPDENYLPIEVKAGLKYTKNN